MIYNKLNLEDDFEENTLHSGYRLFEEDRVKVLGFKADNLEEIDVTQYRVSTRVLGFDGKNYAVEFILRDGRIITENCSCLHEGIRYIPYWKIGGRRCEHLAASIYAVMEYVKSNPLIVPTKGIVASMIKGYQRKALAEVMLEQQEKIELLPIMEKEGTRFFLSFKIGNRKKYVLKNLYEFADYMKTGKQVAYGKDLTVIHHIDSFTKKGQKLVTFILGKVSEMNTMLEEINYYRYAKKPQKRSITLTPSILDEFFAIMDGETIDFINKEAATKRQGTSQVTLRKENPKITVNIERFSPAALFDPTEKEADSTFSGIVVSSNLEGFLPGKSNSYLLLENVLYQTDMAFKTTLQPFLQLIQQEENHCVIGMDLLAAFYQEVMEKIRPFVYVNEFDTKQIETILPPSPEFYFYFDTMRDNVICEPKVIYGTEHFNLYDSDKEHIKVRNKTEEFKIMMLLDKYMPYYDEALKIKHCDQKEEIIYNLLKDGFSEFIEYGEVFIADALKHMHIRTNPKVSVSVTVNHNLLSVELDSDAFDRTEILQILKSYQMKKKFHRLKNGDFLKLEDNALSSLGEMMDTLSLSRKELAQKSLTIPAYRALYLDRLLQESEGILYDRDKQIKSMARNFKAVEDTDYDVPASLQHILRPYQKVGYQWLRTIEQYHFGGILADDMGLGKTLQIISVMLASKEEGKKGTSIIICPASLVYNWEKECRYFAPKLSVAVIAGTLSDRKEQIKTYSQYDVVITSYDLVKRDIALYADAGFLYEIIDEAQYIKNHTTLGAKAVKSITAATRFALTGTPIENRLGELWSIFDYLMPGFLYPYEYFKREIEIPITKQIDTIRTQRLKKMVSPFILRRLKKDVLKDLPDKIEQVTYAKMGEEQQALYQAYLAKIRGDLDNKNEDEFSKKKIQILAELTRIREICCDPSLVYDDYVGESAKLETCMELIGNAREGNHKVLLFSQFTSMLSIIEKRLMKEQISYYKITGATHKEERVRLVEQFNTDETSVFLISLKAGGTGLNLTGADIVIHYDPWWNFAAQNQATDRAHRIGQKNVVTVFKLITQNTIEEKIMNIQQSKKELSDVIIGEENKTLTQLSKEELEELLKVD